MGRLIFRVTRNAVITGVIATLFGVLSATDPFAAPRAGGEMRNFTVAMPPKPAPDNAYFDAHGKQRRLSEFRGKVVLVNFWATWCPACIAELPSLDRLQARLGGDEFTVLAVAQQSGDASAVGGFLKSRGLTHLGVFMDYSRRLGRAFGQYAFPTSVLVDRTGRELGRFVGPVEWDSSEAVALIRSHMRKGVTR